MALLRKSGGTWEEEERMLKGMYRLVLEGQKGQLRWGRKAMDGLWTLYVDVS
jgi:hypothetical protein